MKRTMLAIFLLLIWNSAVQAQAPEIIALFHKIAGAAPLPER